MSDSTELTPHVISSMLMYSLSSGSMLIINKLALHAVPLPGVVSVAQFIFAAVCIWVIKITGVAPVDEFEWRKVRAYLLYVLQFVLGIFTNMKAIQVANIETVIVFRACVPIVVCLLESAFLGRQLPNLRSTTSLLIIVFGACGYVYADKAFKTQGLAAYSWVSAYTLVCATQMAYGKYIVGPDMKFQSMWGPTQYTNVLSVLPMIAIAFMNQEQDKLPKVVWSEGAIGLVFASCVVGLAISFTGWHCRALVTATCYTVLGVANKMFTVLANMLIWDQHASMSGVLWLMVCLAGATTYQQAPLRVSEEQGEQRAKISLLKESDATEMASDEERPFRR